MRVLITGAAGAIGRDLRDGLRGRYALLRLVDVAEQAPARDSAEEIVTAGVTDGQAMRAAAEGMDAIVHLAANPIDTPLDVILEPNIVGHPARLRGRGRRRGAAGRLRLRPSHRRLLAALAPDARDRPGALRPRAAPGRSPEFD